MGKKVRRGFTLVEVGLFLGVTGMLFVGMVMGVQGSMFQQRYNDSVQSFAEFLRSIYAQTANVEGNQFAGGGRSEKAIYGKLVTFGEKYNLEGKLNSDKTIFVYTLIGNADSEVGSGNVLVALRGAGASVFKTRAGGGVELAGVVDQYFPRWSAGIQTTRTAPYIDFKGTLLVVRHPNSGTTFTYILRDTVIEVNEKLKNSAGSLPDIFAGNILNSFRIEDIDFCINPEPEKRTAVRRDVRIVEGARNASGVEIIGQDDKDGNRCK